MTRLSFFVAALCAAVVAPARADTLQLKDNSAITGKVLAEKRDQIVVDVGYTVLLVPRTEVSKITKDEPVKPASTKASPKTTKAKAGASPAMSKGFYGTSTGALPERSVRELVQTLGQSVVQVRTPGGLGSGFFINEDGYLITNFHVIEGETKISLEVYQQKGGQLERKNYKDVRIIAMNKFQDLALLKVEDKDAGKFSPVPMGNADILAVGERVFAIGSPLGLERTVTEGIVSTKTRQMQGSLYLQTTAQINPGNSGGPLFNMRGEVIGVTNMKITFGEGLGFAIPVEQLIHFLEHRDAFAYDSDNPANPYRYLEPPSRLKHDNGKRSAK
ncbi:MAG TPA: trypsin-like peptidase domain-containing protein [Verrucomicrobiae bacterium]|jgi:serine protease Do